MRSLQDGELQPHPPQGNVSIHRREEVERSGLFSQDDTLGDLTDDDERFRRCIERNAQRRGRRTASPDTKPSSLRPPRDIYIKIKDKSRSKKTKHQNDDGLGAASHHSAESTHVCTHDCSTNSSGPASSSEPSEHRTSRSQSDGSSDHETDGQQMMHDLGSAMSALTQKLKEEKELVRQKTSELAQVNVHIQRTVTKSQSQRRDRIKSLKEQIAALQAELEQEESILQNENFIAKSSTQQRTAASPQALDDSFTNDEERTLLVIRDAIQEDIAQLNRSVVNAENELKSLRLIVEEMAQPGDEEEESDNVDSVPLAAVETHDCRIWV